MKSKRIIAALLAGIMCMSVFAGCSNGDSGKETTQSSVKTEQSETKDENTDQQSTEQESSKTEDNSQAEQSQQTTASESTTHTLYIRDGDKNKELSAVFINTVSGKTEEKALTKVREEEDNVTYSCDNDVSLYNMVHLKYSDNVTMDVAFNKFVSGWYLKDEALLPYVEGTTPDYNPKYKVETFKFDGYDKNVYIWTPKDYDEKAEEKYSTIYLFDGQNVLDVNMGGIINCWNVAESVESMMAVTDYKAIIVAIETLGSPDGTTSTRADELIPDLGEFAKYEGMTADDELKSKKRGGALADFICDTVMPKVQKDYNVYDDKMHTFLAGSSFGGLATYYTVLSHSDKFGAGGVFSPSFGVYDDNAWAKFVETVDKDNLPFMYIYDGGYYTDNGKFSENMYKNMLEAGYPKDKIVFDKYEPGQHFETYWRNAFPEFLEAAFTQKLDGLEEGAVVEYVDKTEPDNNPANVSETETSADLAGMADYLYYDNSETKWDKVFAYWWGNETKNKITGEPYGKEWPGVEMEKIEGTDIYRIAVPVGPSGFIFNSGVTDDEVKKGTTAYQTVDLPYSASKYAGKIYKIDMSVEAEKGRGVEKTKFRYPAGEWSDYKE